MLKKSYPQKWQQKVQTKSPTRDPPPGYLGTGKAKAWLRIIETNTIKRNKTQIYD